MTETLFEPEIVGDARISPCGTWRYTCTRTWNPAAPHLVVAMLNPSKADAKINDPTATRVIGFGRALGYGGVIIVNQFAYRATDPKNLPATLEEAVGPENDSIVAEVVRGMQVLCAWGTHGTRWGRDRAFVDLLRRAGAAELWCLGTTKDGHPRHPLYLPNETKPVRFTIRPEETRP